MENILYRTAPGCSIDRIWNPKQLTPSLIALRGEMVPPRYQARHNKTSRFQAHSAKG